MSPSRPRPAAVRPQSGEVHRSPSIADQLRDCLERLDRLDPRLRAMAWVDRPGALQAAAEADVSTASLPLRGLPVGIKDVLDVQGMPTRAGSRSREGVEPARADADVVRSLKEAGCIVVGKTKTTELACMDPTDTINPWNPRRTPGGSSSGSAAAVAAGLVPVAVGTQTAGSLCRPAAYCGVAAMKPSYGLLPTGGLVPLAPSFDTLGIMAATIEDLVRAMTPLGVPSSMQARPFTVGVVPAGSFADADEQAAAHLDLVAGLIERSGLERAEVEPLRDSQEVLALHRVVMAREAWQAHQALLSERGVSLGRHVAELLRLGSRVPQSAYAEALQRIADLRQAQWARTRGVDAVLTLPVPASAPDRSTTGSADYQIPWTAFRGPLVVIPGSLDRAGMPLATMVASPPGSDGVALAVAARLAAWLPRLTPPAVVTGQGRRHV